MKKLFVIALAALATLTASAQTMGKVNFNELVMLMPEYETAIEKMDAAQKEAQETMAAMAEEGQSKYAQYQQKQATWTAAIREAKERELADIQQRYQDFQQNISQELQVQQQQLLAPIQEKVLNTVKEVAKNKGLAVLFDESQAIYFNEAIVVDINPDVRKVLNIPDDRTIESIQAKLQARANQE